LDLVCLLQNADRTMSVVSGANVLFKLIIKKKKNQVVLYFTLRALLMYLQCT